MEDLIKRLEEAEKGSVELDEAIMAHFYRREERFIGAWEDDGMDEKNVRRVKNKVWVDPATDKWVCTHAKPYTTSLDAALTLVPDGAQWKVGTRDRKAWGILDGDPEVYWADLEIGEFSCDTAALSAPLALCITALKARATTA